jgi:hypothetical protein
MGGNRNVVWDVGWIQLAAANLGQVNADLFVWMLSMCLMGANISKRRSMQPNAWTGKIEYLCNSLLAKSHFGRISVS